MPGWRRRRGRGSGQGIQPCRIRRFIEPVVLLLLHMKPTHGYGLLEGFERLGLQNYPTDISAIYRVLYDMEAGGMLVSTQDDVETAGPPRRLYELTEAGDAHLRAWVGSLRETDRILHRFLAAYDSHRTEHEEAIPTQPDPTGPGNQSCEEEIER